MDGKNGLQYLRTHIKDAYREIFKYKTTTIPLWKIKIRHFLIKNVCVLYRKNIANSNTYILLKNK